MASDSETQSPGTVDCGDLLDEVYLQHSQPKPKTSSKNKKSRGPTKCHDLLAKRNKAKLAVTVDSLGNPEGPYKANMASFVGVLIRTNVLINIRDWRLVPTQIKEKMWEALKATFEIRDAEEHKDKKITRMGNIFRGSKAYHTKYVRDMMENEPNNMFIIPDRYNETISQAEWNEFVEVRCSKKWEDLSKQNSTNKAKDKYCTYLGRGGYSKFKEDKGMEFVDRHVLWRGAHARYGGEVEGDGVCLFPEPKTFEVTKEIDDLLCKIAEGKETLGDDEDVLQRVLKKKPHPAKLLTGEVAATLSDKFPIKSRKGKSVALDEERGKRKAAEDELTLLRQQLDEEIRKRKATEDELTSQRSGPNAECDNTIVVLVVHPTTGCNPTGIDGYTEPVYQMIIYSPEDGHNRYGPSNVSYVAKLNDWLDKQQGIPSFMFDIPIDCFGEGILHSQLLIDTIDIKDFYADGEMEKSFVALYAMILYKRCQAETSTHIYGFADPQAITDDDSYIKQQGVDASVQRLMKSMMIGYVKQKLISVPWLKGYHWMLIVVTPEHNEALCMDPKNNIIKDEARVLLDKALCMFHKHRSGKFHKRKFGVKRVQVPMQKDNINCRYYVCRFMKRIIERGWKSIEIGKHIFEPGLDTYESIHIEEIKEEIVRFFMMTLILERKFSITPPKK